MSSRSSRHEVRPTLRGSVVGVGLGRFVFAGRGVAMCCAAAIPALIWTLGASAGPENARVVAGDASITQNGRRTVIRASDNTIIQYSSFDVGRNEYVKFVQPGATARVLNRIDSATPTRIDGTVKANGIVYFVNPSGIMFGQGSVINVNGLYAAAGQMSNQDFLSGVNRFTNVQGEVVNLGRIDAGTAALVGKHVSNAGSIASDGGVIAMVAGDEVVLSRRGDPMSVRVAPDNLPAAPGKAGVENSGSVSAGRGKARIIAGDMYSLAISNTGTVRASDVVVRGEGSGRVQVSGTIDASASGAGERGGRIEITGQHVGVTSANINVSGPAGGGAVLIGGEAQGRGSSVRNAQTAFVDPQSTIRADATMLGDGGSVVVWSDTHSGVYGDISAKGGRTGGNGGFIETSGKLTLDLRGAKVDASAKRGRAGTWLLDPFNVTITNATSNGVFDGGSPTNTYTPTGTGATVDAGAISTALSTGASGTNIVISTAGAGAEPGNIAVNANITKNSANNCTLTLQADGGITVNNAIAEAGAGRLNVNLQAGNGTIVVGANITTNGGTFTSNSTGATTFNANVDTSTAGGGGGVQVTASDVNFGLVGGSISSGNAGIALVPRASVTNVNINSGNTDFSISASDLARLGTTGTVQIGLPAGSQAVALNSSSALNLIGQTYSLQLRGASLTISNQLIMPTGTTFGAVISNTSTIGGSIGFAGASVSNSVGITSDTILLNQGINSNGGQMVFTGTNFTSGASGTITSAGGVVLLNMIGVIDLSGSVDGSGGSLGGAGTLLIRGSQLDIQPGATVSSGVGGLSIVPGAGPTTFAVNGAGGAGIYQLSAAELGRLSVPAGATLTLGSSSDAYATSVGGLGAIDLTTISGLSSANLSVGGQTVTLGGGLTMPTGRALLLSAASTITTSAPIGFAGASPSNSVTFSSSGGLVTMGSGISTQGGTLSATGAGIINTGAITTAGGSVTLTSTASVDVQGNINASGGAGSVTLTGTDLNINPGVTVSSGSGGMAIVPAAGGITSIALNGAGGAGVMQISLAELGRLSVPSGASLTIGQTAAPTTVDVNVGGLGAVDLSAIPSLSGANLVLGARNLGFTNRLTAGTGASTTLRIADLAFTGGSAGITGGSGGLVITPMAGQTTLGINGTPKASTLNLTAADFAGITLPTNAVLTLGLGGGPFAVDVGSGGAIDISGAAGLTTADFAVGGQTATFNDVWTLPAGAKITLNSATVTATDATANRLAFADSNGVIAFNVTNSVALGTGAGFLDISSVSGNLDLVTFNNLSQVGPLTVGAQTRVRSRNNSGAEIRLSNANNVFGAGVTLEALQSDLTTPATADVVVRSNGAYTLTLGTSDQLVDASSGAVLTVTNVAGGVGDVRLDGASVIVNGAVNGANVDVTGGAATVNGSIGAGVATVGVSGLATVNGTITTTGRTTITAADVVLANAANRIVAGTDGVVLQPTSPGAGIAINDGRSGPTFAISADELRAITTSGQVIIGRSSGTHLINVGSLGLVDLSMTGYDLTLRGGNVDFAGGLTLGNDMQLSVLSSGSVISSVGTAVLTIGGAGGGILIRANNDVNVQTSVSQIAMSSATGSVDVTNTGGPGLSVTQLGWSDPLVVGSTINVDGLSVAAAGRSINVGTDTALLLVRPISALGGDVGISIAGNLFVTGTTTPSIIARNLSISSTGGNVGGGSTLYTTIGSSTQAGTLDVTAPGGIDINNGLGTRLDLSSVALNSTSGFVKLVNSGFVTSSGMADWVGAGFDVQSTQRFLWLRDGIVSSGDVSLLSQEVFILDAGKAVNAGMGSISLIANDLALEGTLDADTRVDIGFFALPGPAPMGGWTIGLGNATGSMTISNAELGRVVSPELRIGGNNVSRITVDGVQASGVPFRTVLAAPSSDGRVTFSGTASSFGALNVVANNGVDFNVNVSTTGAELFVNGDADASGVGGNDRVAISSGVTLAAATGLTLGATTGGVVASGNVTLRAGAGVSITSSYTNTGGDTTIDSDFDADSTGTFTLASGSTITVGDSMNARNIRINAADFDLRGMLDAPGGAVTLSRSTSGEIWLGDVTGAPMGAMQLDVAELANIACRSFDLGGSTATLLHVAGLQNNASGGMLLDRMRVTTRIALAGADITITPSQLNAGGADLVISRSTAGTVGVGTATGDMTIDNFELARTLGKSLTIQSVGSTGGNAGRDVTVRDVSSAFLTGIAEGVSFLAGNSLTLTDTGGGADPNRFRFHTLTAHANNGLTVNANLTTTTGDLSLNGDLDNGTEMGAQTNNRIRIAPGRTLSAGRDVLVAGAGGATADGALTINASRDVAIQTNMLAQGTLSANADTDDNGAGSFIVNAGATIDTNGNNLNVTAADLRLLGTNDMDTSARIRTGNGAFSIDRSTVGTINLGGAEAGPSMSASDPMTIAGLELQRIRSTGQSIGGTNTNLMLVDGVTGANVAQLSGTTTLRANAAGGQINFNSNASTFNALDAAAAGTLSVNRNLTTTVGGMTLGGTQVDLGANIDSTNTADVAINGVTNLTTSSVTVDGKNVSFNGNVTSTGAARSLSVTSNNDGITRFNGNVGTSGARLFTLTTNADGETRATGSIFAQGNLRFDDALILSGANPTVATSGGAISVGRRAEVRGTFKTDGPNGNVAFGTSTNLTGNFLVDTTGGGTVRFGDRVFSTGGNHDLTIDLANATTTSVPTVEFVGVVGRQATGTGGKLGNVRLNTDGRTAIPPRATIITRGDSVFDLTGDFTMGPREKLTALGSLTILTPGMATIGDLTAARDIRVSAGTIKFNPRGAGPLRQVKFNPLQPNNSTLEQLRMDDGLDMVSAFGKITFQASAPISSATGSGALPVFGTATGVLGGDLGVYGGAVVRTFQQVGTDNSVPAAQSGTILERLGQVFDLKASGPSVATPVTGIARAVPRDNRVNAVGEEATVDASTREALDDMKLNPRTATVRELLDAVVGTATFDDVPSKTTRTLSTDDFTVVLNRMPYLATKEVASDYVEIFGDKSTRTVRVTAIKNQLKASVDRFREANKGAKGEVDPASFRAFLEQGEAERGSLNEVLAIEQFFSRLSNLGLTPSEEGRVRRGVLNPINPDNAAFKSIQKLEGVFVPLPKTASR